MQKVLLGVGLMTGLLVAFIDSQPAWNDSGITAGSLFLSSGLLTLPGYRRPWLMALAVGIWIPLRSIYLFHDVRMLLVLLFPLAGAYAGSLIGFGIRKTTPRT